MLSVEFVATPDPDAEVRCALHDPDTRVYVADGALDLGVADFQGSPGGVGGEDGYRRITATVTVVSDEWSARRFQSALARELLRAENYLRVQFTEDTPVMWFHTWRTTPGPMDLQAVDAGIWQFTVQVDADAYSLGEMVQQGVRLSNDPTVDGGVAVVLDDTPGDAPAPLIISGLDQGDGPMFRPLVSVAPLSRWDGLQWWKPVTTDSATWRFTGTVAMVTDTEASSGAAAIKAPLSNGDVVRFKGAVTTTQAGTFRLFARIRGTTSDMTLTAGGRAALRTTTLTGLNGAGTYFYADMGLYAFPRGNTPLEDGYTLASIGSPTDYPDVQLTATVATGPTNLYLDHIVAVPVDLYESTGDARMLLLDQELIGYRIDGDQERLGPIPSFDPVKPRLTSPSLVGDFPQITPGAVNVLTVLSKVQADGDAMSDTLESLGVEAALNIRHRPRFLYQASA